jgi:hypothetical protein
MLGIELADKKRGIKNWANSMVYSDPMNRVHDPHDPGHDRRLRWS